jgi:hypothetical protein
MATNNGRGAPKGNQNRLTHGLVAFQKEIKRRTRRGRSLIDRRSTAGRNAVAMREELIADQGGAENMSIAKLALIEMIARDVYFLDECDRRIFKAIYKLSSSERELAKIGKLKHPKVIGLMYSYRQGVAQILRPTCSPWVWRKHHPSKRPCKRSLPSPKKKSRRAKNEARNRATDQSATLEHHRSEHRAEADRSAHCRQGASATQ